MGEGIPDEKGINKDLHMEMSLGNLTLDGEYMIQYTYDVLLNVHLQPVYFY